MIGAGHAGLKYKLKIIHVSDVETGSLGYDIGSVTEQFLTSGSVPTVSIREPFVKEAVMFIQGLLSLFLLSCLIFTPLGGSVAAEKVYRADRFDVTIDVQTDGTLLITETIVFRFSGGPFTYAYRHLPTAMTDGVEIVGATLDGVLLPEGQQVGQVEIERGEPIKITWHFAPTSDSVHTFGLTYRVYGVIQQKPGADVLRWQALPEKHDYPITRSTVTVTYPAFVERLDAPQVTDGLAEVTADTGRVTFNTHDLRADGYFIFELRFAPGSLITAPPQWQARQLQEQARRAQWSRWAWPSLLGAVLVFSGGLWLLLAYQKRFQSTTAATPFVVNRPPSDRAPALAGVLAQHGALQYSWDYALGAFFALAQRGVICVEERAESHWYRKRTFVLRLHTFPADLRPHERAALEVFFGTKKGLSSEVAVHTLQNSVASRLQGFTEVLKAEAAELGFFDPARQRGRALLVASGVSLVCVSLALAVVGLLLLTQTVVGPWPVVLVTGSLFLLGITALIVSSTIAPLTERWLVEAAGWSAFKKYLWEVIRQREDLPYAVRFIEYLPYAAAFGLADAWGNFLKRQEGVELPAWFQGLTAAHADGQAGFVAMIAAVNASGASSDASASAAGAAAGAAGGGASGAG